MTSCPDHVPAVLLHGVLEVVPSIRHRPARPPALPAEQVATCLTTAIWRSSGSAPSCLGAGHARGSARPCRPHDHEGDTPASHDAPSITSTARASAPRPPHRYKIHLRCDLTVFGHPSVDALSAAPCTCAATSQLCSCSTCHFAPIRLPRAILLILCPALCTILIVTSMLSSALSQKRSNLLTLIS